MSAIDVMLSRQSPDGPPPPGSPGDPRVRTPQDRELRSIYMGMGQGFKLLGDELLKENPDPLTLVKARAMIAQATAAIPRPAAAPPPPRPVNLEPRTGVPRPVDGEIDATTGRPRELGAPFQATRT